MDAPPLELASINQPTATELALAGRWTARGIGAIQEQLASLRVSEFVEEALRQPRRFGGSREGRGGGCARRGDTKAPHPEPNSEHPA